jgi:hypothetical protein
MYNLPAEHVPHYFTGSKSIYRILADKSYQELSYVTAGRLWATINGERLAAPDIAWCLHYGNWPKFPLVQLDGNPFNCSIDNLMPARHKRLRYRETARGGKFYHPLEKMGFSTPEQCLLNWQAHARDYYMQDLHHVLAIEAEERELRRGVEVPPPVLTKVRRPRSASRKASGLPPRPALVEGMEWHWYEGAWVSVPVACHVADDYLQRLRKWKAGAVRFVFQPTYREVWGFRADGTVVP